MSRPHEPEHREEEPAGENTGGGTDPAGAGANAGVPAEHGLPQAPPEVRDPWKGLRGVMAGTLVLEFIVFALALLVVWRLASGAGTVGFTVVAVLTVLNLLAAFVQRHRWGLGVALVLQAGLIGCFFVHPAIGLMGLVFAGIWGYILYLRQDVATRMREGRLADQLGHPPGQPPQG